MGAPPAERGAGSPPGDAPDRADGRRQLPGPGRRRAGRHRERAPIRPTQDPSSCSAGSPGWCPLRPRAGTHRAVRSRIATHAGTARSPWVVADLADQLQRNDPWPATVAERAERLWGPGLCYLAGIGWGDPTAPVLGPEAVGRLLERGPHPGVVEPRRHPRPAPAWSRASSTAASPLQVMPPRQAAELRAPAPPSAGAARHRPRGPGAPIDPSATAPLLDDAAAIVLAGSADRDLALAVAAGGSSGQPCLTSGRARPAGPATSPVGPRRRRHASSGSTRTRRRSTRRCGRRSSGSTRWQPASTGSRPGSTSPVGPASGSTCSTRVAGHAEVLRRIVGHPGPGRGAGPPPRRARPVARPSPGPQRLHDLLEPRRPCCPPRSHRASPLSTTSTRPTAARCSCSTTARPTSPPRWPTSGPGATPGSGWSTRRRTSGSPRGPQRAAPHGRHDPRLPARRRQHRGGRGRRGRLRGRPALRGGVHLRHRDQGRSGGAGPRRHLERAGLGAVAPVQLHRHDGGGRRGGAAAPGRLAGGPRARARRRLGARPPHRPGRRAHRLRARGRRPLPRAARSAPPLGARPPRRPRSRRPHVRPDPAAAGRRRGRLRRPIPTSARCGRRPPRSPDVPTSASRPPAPAPPLDGRAGSSSSRPGGVENLGDDAITVAALEHLAGTGLALDVVTDGDRPVGLPATAEWLGTLHEAVGGLRPADLEDDDRVAGAAARAQVGRLDHRPVEPGRYRAAVLPRRRQPHVALGRRARRPAGGPRLRAAAGRRAVRAERARPRPARRRGPGTGRPARRGRPGRGRARRAGARPALGAPATGDDALLLAVEPPGATAAPPYLVLSLRAADYVGASAAELERWAAEVDAYAVRARAHRPRRALQRPARRGRGRHAARAGPHGVSAVGPVAGRATTTRILGGWPRCWPAPTRSSRTRTTPPCSGSAPASRRCSAPARPTTRRRPRGCAQLVALPAELVVRPGAPLDLARRSPPWPTGLAGGGVARARADVAAWWDATIGDLLGADARPAVSG